MSQKITVAGTVSGIKPCKMPDPLSERLPADHPQKNRLIDNPDKQHINIVIGESDQFDGGRVTLTTTDRALAESLEIGGAYVLELSPAE